MKLKTPFSFMKEKKEIITEYLEDEENKEGDDNAI